MNIEITNLTGTIRRPCGLAIASGRVGIVDGGAWEEWRRANPMQAAGLSAKVAPESDADKLDRLCRFCIEEAPAHPWDLLADRVTRDGRPTCAYASEFLGRAVSAAERDAAWERVRA